MQLFTLFSSRMLQCVQTYILSPVVIIFPPYPYLFQLYSIFTLQKYKHFSIQPTIFVFIFDIRLKILICCCFQCLQRLSVSIFVRLQWVEVISRYIVIATACKLRLRGYTENRRQCVFSFRECNCKAFQYFFTPSQYFFKPTQWLEEMKQYYSKPTQWLEEIEQYYSKPTQWLEEMEQYYSKPTQWLEEIEQYYSKPTQWLEEIEQYYYEMKNH